MVRFSCDYSEGAHPRLLERLAQLNLEQFPGYGEDAVCDEARATIRGLCQAPEAQVQFLVGGTQANFTLIAAALRPHQGVLAAQTGHIAAHESGAVVATGHKVLTLPSADGKITADQIARACRDHWNDSNHEHLVQPGMVYVSLPTENGTIYSLAELTAISRVCRAEGLTLYVDGARLGCALAAGDVQLPDLARLCDAFTIGGTKLGALFGEALVITSPALARDFRYIIKQRGGMLAKGWLLGAQFQTLLADGLYLAIARQEVAQALRIRAALEQAGYPLRYDSPTNQQFPILPDDQLARLEQDFSFSFWEKMDETHSAVRICTSWATRDADVDALIAALKQG